MYWFRFVLMAVLLLLTETLYFVFAKKRSIVDRPNDRSSHSKVVLRGGGIIFVVSIWIWSFIFGFHYPWFLAAVTVAASISFLDDMHPLKDRYRLAVHVTAMLLMFYQLDMLHLEFWWMDIIILILCVGAINIFNFMDGVNGITPAYALSVLLPVFILNYRVAFVKQSLLLTVIIATLIFAFLNFRPKNKALCFAGDVGSVGISVILLFVVGCLIRRTYDMTWLIFLVVYGVDGCCTILHRIMLHENLGKAHRKHCYQIMANELGLGHLAVALIYSFIQLAVSLVMIYFIPNTLPAHFIYLGCVLAVLIGAYVLFMKKYYHLHEEYLASLDN